VILFSFLSFHSLIKDVCPWAKLHLGAADASLETRLSVLEVDNVPDGIEVLLGYDGVRKILQIECCEKARTSTFTFKYCK